MLPADVANVTARADGIRCQPGALSSWNLAKGLADALARSASAADLGYELDVIDLDAYFTRIGYAGSTEPSLATLNAISMAHVCAIPFENLDVLRGVPIDLDPGALEQKLVHARRGGYCFEQNTLLLEVLGQLGFRAQPISARVRWGRTRDYTPARTHLFVRVELAEGSFLADVGVGSMSLTRALQLGEGEQATPHEPRRIIRENDRLYHQARLGDTWHDVNEFTLEEMPLIDRIVGNWYTSAHPQSHFRSRLIAARATPDGGRITLADRDLTQRARNGAATVTRIADHAELLAVLERQFGITLPAGTQLAWPGLDWTA
ncbi:MAG: arylamine N-acetyltransferase [Kofleriaceae bacterium]|nr:arylamine N-acetyltransferase [Kofleriaceae bacterium]